MSYYGPATDENTTKLSKRWYMPHDYMHEIHVQTMIATKKEIHWVKR